MTGLALLISAGLAWVIVHRETNGLSQLKGAIEALTKAVETLQQSADDTRTLVGDMREVKTDVAMLKNALVIVGARHSTPPATPPTQE
jgi:prefoldin subunit 5